MRTTQDLLGSRFQIRGLRGEGGMGDAHLAYDAFSQREVAIKLANMKLLDDPDVGDRMRKMWMIETKLAGNARRQRRASGWVRPRLHSHHARTHSARRPAVSRPSSRRGG